uniref:Lipase_GDSL domain-containing protein n=1 Tax=Parascaris univalens TaxID=6257 RepID=A0A915BTX9_PARUN
MIMCKVFMVLDAEASSAMMAIVRVIFPLICCCVLLAVSFTDSGNSTESLVATSNVTILKNGSAATKFVLTYSENRLPNGSLQKEERRATLSGSGSQEVHDEEEEEEDGGDSDVSEERNVEDYNEKLSPARLPGLHESHQSDAASLIFNSFNNRKTFSCPRIKTDFVTGTDTGDLTPEDIGIIAAMGDSLATGRGLWPHTDIEFRGAAFPIGGDATIDGLVTVPNILQEFNDKLAGVSHGMGTRNQLPPHQLNVAEGGATSSSMPEQARELVRRMKALREVDANSEWAMIIITIGTEEICTQCESPDYASLLEAISVLSKGIRKAFVVLLGPIHVSSSYQQQANLLKSRCGCSKERSDEFMKELSKAWANAFSQLQTHFDSLPAKRRTFGLLALPMLTITSRYPYSLFIANRPLLNRKGHMYATKWLWNRLITGPTYNLSLAVLSQDAYYCPAMGCPYFRTQANRHYCRLLRHVDVAEDDGELVLQRGRRTRRSLRKLYVTAIVVVIISFCAVVSIGTLIYHMNKQGTRGRYEIEPETDPSEAEQSLLGECRQLLPERPLRSSSISSVSSAE